MEFNIGESYGCFEIIADYANTMEQLPSISAEELEKRSTGVGEYCGKMMSYYIPSKRVIEEALNCAKYPFLYSNKSSEFEKGNNILNAYNNKKLITVKCKKCGRIFYTDEKTLCESKRRKCSRECFQEKKNQNNKVEFKTGNKFGCITLLDDRIDERRNKFKCQCECGKILYATKEQIEAKPCYCYKPIMSKTKSNDCVNYIGAYNATELILPNDKYCGLWNKKRQEELKKC